MDTQDTIVAVASAAGGAASGILRLSGPETLAVIARITAPESATQVLACKQSCCLKLKLLLDEVSAGRPSQTLDVQAYLWPTSRSYTKQPSAELHLSGSPPLLEHFLGRLNLAGARLAMPGEFTLRAFLAGRLDLAQAEAVLGVIDARSSSELATALSQLAGGMSGPLAQVRSDLLDLLADLEAGLDFVDEDISFVSPQQVQQRLHAAQSQVGKLLLSLKERSLAGDVPRVVLVGRPNVGKSSLFNRLMGRDAAIVSSTAGTTRDYVTAEVTWQGQTLQLVDTAGLDPQIALQEIDQLAQKASSQQQERSTVCLVCLDCTRKADAWEQQQLTEINPQQIHVLTKTDLASDAHLQSWKAHSDLHYTSSTAHSDLSSLQNAILSRLATVSAGELLPATASRCRESLVGADQALQQSLQLQAGGAGDELIAAEIRIVLDELGKILGVIYTDDLLDRVFSRFCIGK